jgi:CheY-like chemotaxis protein
MDGIEASRQIKNHTGLSKIPAIVMVTAYGREEVMQQAEQLNLEGFLLKPVSPSMLFDATMQAFGVAAPEISRISQRKDREAKALENIQGARVLLVEDNEINQQVAREILEGAGLNVALANDGQEGVNAVKENNYDAVLMDVQMPVMDGYTATRAIRKDERFKELPIIAMTAHAMAGDEDKSLEAGMNGHVAKPIDPDQLFSTLQKWIKPSEKRVQVQQTEVPVERPESDKAVLKEDEFPESLPGFDLAAGLSRLMGNKTLYRKLLLDFGASYGGVANEIREALAVGDFEQAHSLVHNLKGLAGNLEATELHTAAVKMETLVKGQTKETTSEKDLKQKFTDLEKALEQALDAVQALGFPAEEIIKESSFEWLAEFPLERLKKIADHIEVASEMGDVLQIKSLAEELKSESDAVAPFCDELVRLADNFDFEGIQKFMLNLNN